VESGSSFAGSCRPGKNQVKYSIVLSTQPAQFQAATFKGDLEANMARISSYGYTGVELAIRDPGLVNVNQLIDLITKYHLDVPAIDPDPSIRRAAISRIKSHIPIASRFNAIIIIGLIRGIVKKGVDPSISMGWLIDALKECSDAASSSGIRLALEPINRYETTLINNTTQGLILIEKVGVDNFGLLLDTFHMNIEEPEIETSIETCGDRIFHFHVADSNRWHPGAGHLDFKSILSSLFSTGYKEWVSGEFLPEPDDATAAQQGMAHLRYATL
jgi:sugar phosphate isomerase/epimerase